jgi:hypothetical protein
MHRRRCIQGLLALYAASWTGCGSSRDLPVTNPGASPLLPLNTPIAGSELPGPASFLGEARRVLVNDITMAYRQFGSGPALS